MANASTTPEFRRIMKELYESGKYKTSGEVLSETWRIWRRDYGVESSPEQKKRAAIKASFRNPRKKNPNQKCYVVIDHIDIKAGRTFATKAAGFRFVDRANKSAGEKRYWLMTCEAARQFLKDNEYIAAKNPRERLGFAKWSKWGRGFGRGQGWEYQGRRINVRAKGPLPPGAVSLDEQGTMLDLKTGEVYRDQRFSKNPSATWHLKKATAAHLKAKAAEDKEERDHQIGHFEAHLESAEASRKENPRRKRQRKAKTNPIAVYNPRSGVKLPMTDVEIRYRRTNGSYRGKWFRHPYKTSVSIIGLPDGNLLLKSNSHKRLWGKA